MLQQTHLDCFILKMHARLLAVVAAVTIDIAFMTDPIQLQILAIAASLLCPAMIIKLRKHVRVMEL